MMRVKRNARAGPGRFANCITKEGRNSTFQNNEQDPIGQAASLEAAP
jgi:hypothetical protein